MGRTDDGRLGQSRAVPTSWTSFVPRCELADGLACERCWEDAVEQAGSRAARAEVEGRSGRGRGGDGDRQEGPQSVFEERHT